MTDLLSRATANAASGDQLRLPSPLAGVIAGLAAACSGVLVCMGLAVIGWLAGSDARFPEALHVGAVGWLAGHGSGIETVTFMITAVPLGLTLLVAHVAYRAGRWAGIHAHAADARQVTWAAVGLALGYAIVVAVVAAVATSPTLGVSITRPVLISFFLTGGSGWLGAARTHGVLGELVSLVPTEVTAAARGALAGIAVFIGASALAFTAALSMHTQRFADIADSLSLSTVGAALMIAVCLVVFPNAVLLTGSVLLGPGFAFGTGTTVTATTITIGTLPAFPLLAAVPGSGPTPVWAGALAAIPVAAGCVAGWLSVRTSPVFGFDRAALRGLAGGALGGLVIGMLVAVSGGSVGPGRMADVGPQVLSCLLVAVVATAVGGVVGGLGRHFVHHRHG